MLNKREENCSFFPPFTHSLCPSPQAILWWWWLPQNQQQEPKTEREEPFSQTKETLGHFC